jgi:hypothetical protein
MNPDFHGKRRLVSGAMAALAAVAVLAVTARRLSSRRPGNTGLGGGESRRKQTELTLRERGPCLPARNGFCNVKGALFFRLAGSPERVQFLWTNGNAASGL